MIDYIDSKGSPFTDDWGNPVIKNVTRRPSRKFPEAEAYPSAPAAIQTNK